MTRVREPVQLINGGLAITAQSDMKTAIAATQAASPRKQRGHSCPA